MWDLIQHIAQEIRNREGVAFYNKHGQEIIGRFKLRCANSITNTITKYPDESEIVSMIEEYKKHDNKLK